MAKTKTKFKDTKFAGFLNKAKSLIPDVLDVGMDVITGTSPIKAIVSKIDEKIDESKSNGDSNTSEQLTQLRYEYEKMENEFEKEILSLEVKDRDSARNREIELAKSNKSDFMMYATGIIGLSIFGFLVYALFFISIPDNSRDLVIHLMGIIEGVVLSIFSYYFGTSKSSSDKTKMLIN